MPHCGDGEVGGYLVGGGGVVGAEQSSLEEEEEEVEGHTRGLAVSAVEALHVHTAVRGEHGAEQRVRVG